MSKSQDVDELKKRNAELEGDLAFHEQQRLIRWKAEEHVLQEGQ